MMELKRIPIISRVAAYVESYVAERKKREYIDLSHQHRCYMAAEQACREYERIKEKALIAGRPAYYR